MEIGKNSITRRNIRAENPAKSPSAFQDPKTFPVLSAKIPNDRIVGINKWTLWKIKTRTEDNIMPSRTIFARRGLRKTIEEKSIKTKPEKINQKDPISNIVPNKDTWEFEEKRAESRNTKAIPKPDAKSHDFGKIILPSRNLAIAQKIIQAASPNN